MCLLFNRRVSLLFNESETRVLGWFRIRVLIEMVLQLRVLSFFIIEEYSESRENDSKCLDV